MMFDPELDQMDGAIRQLTTRVIDLGVYVEEMFKNAVSLLFARDWSSVFTMFHSTPEVAPVTLVGEAVQVMARWSPTNDRLRMVVALQQAADEFGTMLGITTRIAEKARSFENTVEDYFAQVGPAGQEAFYKLLQSAHIQLRGCIVALSMRQATMATKVITQDGALDQAYLQLQTALRAAIMADPALTAPLGALSVIVADIETLGNHVTRICQRIEAITLGAPPVPGMDAPTMLITIAD
jgi:phosphate uptake regulator